MRLESINSEDSRGLEDLQSRIDAIQLVHEELARAGEVMEVDFPAYLRRLLEMVFASLHESPVSVTVEVLGNGDKTQRMSSKSAVSMGLVLNELATNAVKYSFRPEKEPWFYVALQSETGESYVRLTIEHSGPPLPEGFSVEKTNTLGSQLIREIVTDQLGGTFEVGTNRHPVFVIALPAEVASS